MFLQAHFRIKLSEFLNISVTVLINWASSSNFIRGKDDTLGNEMLKELIRCDHEKFPIKSLKDIFLHEDELIISKGRLNDGVQFLHSWICFL